MVNYKKRLIQTQHDHVTTDITVNNSTSLVTALIITPLRINTTYAFEILIHITTGATPDLKYLIFYPTGSSGKTINADHSITPMAHTALNTSTPELNITDHIMLFKGYFTTGSTIAGFGIQFAQNTADVSDTKCLKGSFLHLTGSQ